MSITPAELFNNYKYGWHDDHRPPQLVIVETQFGWEERYKRYGRPISYFTKSAGANDCIRAFRFSRHDTDGIVNMQIKASAQGTVWYGIDSRPDGLGFVCLPSVPPSYPRCKQPTDFKIKSEYAGRMLNGKIKQYCQENKRMSMYDHFVIMVNEVRVESRPLTDLEMTKVTNQQRGYVTIEHIGSDDCVSMNVPFIRENPAWNDESSFWMVDLLPHLPHLRPHLRPHLLHRVHHWLHR